MRDDAKAGDEERRERGQGALLGLAVGDALGTSLEFERLAPAPFDAPLVGPLVDVVGGGPFHVERGQTTDDTMMAVCLWRSLRARGALDVNDLAARYVAWSRVTFDIGAQTGSALRRMERGEEPLAAGRAVWLSSGRRAAGNGSLMRTAPIAVFFATDDEARVRATVHDSQMTHADPRCVLACAALNGAIAAAVSGAARDAAAGFRAAFAEIARAADLLPGDPEDDLARAQIEADLRAAEGGEPALYGHELHMHEMQGFVRVALRLAFFELARERSFEAALLDVVNRGGDADTNGAITGALLGAFRGRSAIPPRFVDAVLSALATAPPGPLRDEYHPRAFVDSWFMGP